MSLDKSSEFSQTLKISKLSSSFADALNKRISRDTVLLTQLTQSLSKDDVEEIKQVGKDRILENRLSIFSSITGAIEANLAYSEIVVKHASKVLSPDEISAFLPKELTKDDAITTLKDNKSNRVAGIAEHSKKKSAPVK